MTKLALVTEVWVGGGGTFHGCVTDPRLMMIPQGNLFWVVRRFVGADDPQKNLF
jgi:hypothetical protein